VTLVVAVLAVLALVYVLLPLTRRAPETLVSSGRDAEVRKLQALEAILDLEGELAAGKLSADDYEVFKETYERDALAAMRELDVASQGVADDLEAEIAAARAQLR
jgi:hypothetical protein